MLHFDGTVDRNPVIPRLWQGAAPAPDAAFPFDVLVLAAKEYQPPDHDFPGVVVLRAPLEDTLKPTEADLELAKLTARHVLLALRNKQNVLVTCHKGLNRSGLITGLVLRYLGYSGNEALRLIKEARGSFALSNSSFAEIVKRAL